MEYEIKIVHSSRKSLLLSVSAENEIKLRCPRNISENRINAFIESKKSWLDKVTARNEIKLSSDKGVLGYKEIYVGGIKLPLLISDKNKITDGAVYVSSLKNIKRVFVSRFKDEFISFAESLSAQCGLRACGFFIKSYKSRWGSCNSRNEITFNYKLFMLPESLQRYVIVHEICHTVHFNHSKDFWKLVSRFEPDYKNLRTRLKSFGYITNLY